MTSEGRVVILDFGLIAEQSPQPAGDVSYEYAWFAFDNDSGTLTALGPPRTTRDERIDLPAQQPEFLMVRLRTRTPGRPRWETAVDVYLRRGREVVGIGRET